jgi:HK97 gp10 family phage protein
MTTPKLVVRFNHLPTAKANLPRAIQTMLRRAADDVRLYAQGRARVDTGRMRGSIRVVSVTPKQAIIRTGTPTVYWSIFNEYGTIKMSAAPFMRPAADRVGARLASGSYAGDFERELL